MPDPRDLSGASGPGVFRGAGTDARCQPRRLVLPIGSAVAANQLEYRPSQAEILPADLEVRCSLKAWSSRLVAGDGVDQ